MTLADIMEDTDLEALWGQDIEEPCTFVMNENGEECGKPASWRLTGDCGHSVTWCQEHVSYAIQFDREYPNGGYHCNTCNKDTELFKFLSTRRML
ncbi:hypothetical protein HOT81_gp012 [Gordonia phage Fryberger]|uniref:Uncharacterized protein n=1 Tax=Gordonia phage Fryberger TaxID=2250392 RepID=A0A346FCG7_9CAUD|nr:hypothetical protein HOT81_gp012 [Gordonia phage Fryberger]AXN53431.1 hypothetical protein SEA_FRYBERGER_12 [Gordonia phage Fryberger]